MPCRSRRRCSAADARVGRDRVDEAVGADLARVVGADRHAELDPGPDEQQATVEISLVQPDPLLVLLRHDRGDDRAVDLLERQPAQAQQRGDADRQLVGGGRSRRREAEVLHELLAAEHAEVGLGVADVDCQEHGPGLSQSSPKRVTRWSLIAVSARSSSSRSGGCSSSSGSRTKRRFTSSGCGTR